MNLSTAQAKVNQKQKEEKPMKNNVQTKKTRDVQLFNFKGNDIRTVMIEDEPWFVGKDVASVLGYSNGSRDVNVHTDEEDRLKYRISTAGQIREQTVINESGLYSLILSSKLPEAKEFKHWVTSEVLPTVRKHGAYMTDQKAAEVVENPETGYTNH